MDPALLRQATRPEHEATEAQMPLMREGLTREQYTAVLAKLYPLLAGWERWSHEHAPAELAAMVRGRDRAPLLASDLACLGVAVPPEAGFAPQRIPGLAGEPVDTAAFLGAMYVMEGSTLGGQHLARHLEPLLGLSAECGTAYFRGYGAQTGERWREFQAAIKAVPETEGERVIAAARAMFQVFGESL